MKNRHLAIQNPSLRTPPVYNLDSTASWNQWGKNNMNKFEKHMGRRIRELHERMRKVEWKRNMVRFSKGKN